MSFGDIFSKLFKKTILGESLGIDIGTTSIKAVELLKNIEGVIELVNYGELENYGHLERLNDAIQTSSLKMLEEEASNLLKMLSGAAQIKTKNVVMTVPVFSAFVTIMEFPKMSQAEIAQAIPFQAKQFIPIPVSDTVLDWSLVEPTAEEVTFRNLNKTLVLMVAVPKEVIERYRRVTKLANFQLKALELETLSLIRALLGGDRTPTVLIDIGARATSFSVVDNGYLRMVKTFDLAGGELTQALSNGLKISVWRAEELKKLKGLQVRPGEEEIANLMYPVIDAILGEAKKLIQLYLTTTGRKIEKLILTGGSANMPGLVDYTASQFEGVAVTRANAFSRIKIRPELEPLIRSIADSFGVCVGSSLRPLIE